MFGRKKKEMDPETYIKGKQAEMTNLIKATFESAGWDYTFKTESNTIVSGAGSNVRMSSRALRRCSVFRGESSSICVSLITTNDATRPSRRTALWCVWRRRWRWSSMPAYVWRS